MVFTPPAGTEATPHAVAAEPVAAEKLRLLLVDDDPLVLESLRTTLTFDGHEVVTANSGQAGIDTFNSAVERGETFSAVITDLGMPHVDGRKVAAAVKQTSAKTPVFLLTGWGQGFSTEGDIPPNVDGVLGKPPKLRDLRKALAQLNGG
jgi:CheY-like chemotaxis protein